MCKTTESYPMDVSLDLNLQIFLDNFCKNLKVCSYLNSEERVLLLLNNTKMILYILKSTNKLSEDHFKQIINYIDNIIEDAYINKEESVDDNVKKPCNDPNCQECNKINSDEKKNRKEKEEEKNVKKASDLPSYKGNDKEEWISSGNSMKDINNKLVDGIDYDALNNSKSESESVNHSDEHFIGENDENSDKESVDERTVGSESDNSDEDLKEDESEDDLFGDGIRTSVSGCSNMFSLLTSKKKVDFGIETSDEESVSSIINYSDSEFYSENEEKYESEESEDDETVSLLNSAPSEGGTKKIDND